MSRWIAFITAFMAGCSTGLRPADSGDTEPVDTDTSVPLDTADTDIDTDTDTNQAPVADAGVDQSAQVGDVIALDGSNSYDPDDDPVEYEWEFVEVPPTSSSTLINFRTTSPEFYADRAGTYRVQLTVDDGDLAAVDEVVIEAIAPNDVPVADAGPDQTVAQGATVQLNGGNSYDPDSDPLDYRWEFTLRPTGSAAVLTDSDTAVPRFSADAAGSYMVELIVNDGTNDSAPDTVRVNAQAPDDGDCLSCSAAARREVERRLRAGTAASGPGLMLLPLFVLLWQRRRDRDE